MGTDIYACTEVLTDGRWTRVYASDPDDSYPEFGRNYAIFGFLADVRNYSHSPVIAEPRGLPADVSVEVRVDYSDEASGTSWLTVAELLAYDYDRAFWDRRIERSTYNPVTGVTSVNGAALAEEGEGEHVTLREHLGRGFFGPLDRLAELGAPADVRIVFWFGG